jgi:hypothetical protein
MSTKLTRDDEKHINELLKDVASEIIDYVNDCIDTAYHYGWKDGEMETVERLKEK